MTKYKKIGRPEKTSTPEGKIEDLEEKLKAAYSVNRMLMDEIEEKNAEIWHLKRVISFGLMVDTSDKHKRADRIIELRKQGLNMVEIQKAVFSYSGGWAWKFVHTVLSSHEDWHGEVLSSI